MGCLRSFVRYCSMNMYHVTLKHNLLRIQSEGLKTRLGPRSLAAGESIPGIFTFQDLETFETSDWFREVFQGELRSELAVLQLEVPDDSLTETDIFGELMLRKNVPPSAIQTINYSFQSFSRRSPPSAPR